MHAMQYEITLPADYDMAIIERRVATRGSLLDDFPGLGLKAYAVRRRGIHASTVNQYAPFYLWRSVEGMKRFLLGDGFRGLCESFGRPSVRHGVGLSFRAGRAFAKTPVAATRTVRRLSVEADLAELAGEPGPGEHPDLHRPSADAARTVRTLRQGQTLTHQGHS